MKCILGRRIFVACSNLFVRIFDLIRICGDRSHNSVIELNMKIGIVSIPIVPRIDGIDGDSDGELEEGDSDASGWGRHGSSTSHSQLVIIESRAGACPINASYAEGPSKVVGGVIG